MNTQATFGAKLAGLEAEKYRKDNLKPAFGGMLNKLVKGATAAVALPIAAPALGAAASGIGAKLGGMAGAAKGIGSTIAGKVKGAVTGDEGGFDWGKLLKLGTGALAAKGQHDSSRDAKEYLANETARREALLKMASDQYAQRQPMRDLSMATLASLGQRKDVFRDYMGG